MKIPPINFPNVPQFGGSPNDPVYDLLEYLEGPNGLLAQMKNDPNFPGDIHDAGGWDDKISDLYDKLHDTLLGQLQDALSSGKISKDQYDQGCDRLLNSDLNAIFGPLLTFINKSPAPTKDDLATFTTQLSNGPIAQLYADYLDLVPH